MKLDTSMAHTRKPMVYGCFAAFGFDSHSKNQLGIQFDTLKYSN
jgi:hypothetical protein